VERPSASPADDQAIDQTQLERLDAEKQPEPRPAPNETPPWTPAATVGPARNPTPEANGPEGKSVDATAGREIDLPDGGETFVEAELPPDFWGQAEVPTAPLERTGDPRRGSSAGSATPAEDLDDLPPAGTTGRRPPPTVGDAASTGSGTHGNLSNAADPGLALLQEVFPGRIVEIEATAPEDGVESESGDPSDSGGTGPDGDDDDSDG
jgi:hypothetical protein